MIIAHPESVGTAAAAVTVKVALAAAALLPLLVCKALSASVFKIAAPERRVRLAAP